ncbi:3-oxoacyl-ACP synthase [Lentzea sp. NBRC 105346]|uniref:beta-ketoacyl-[acyl-carrier-protein] synthase family protein n=1 Tax=Lentzea sp. NBRC 105346 TaxID=3032205 RepID=UPI0024A3970B|nr:beta-ketoacyl-[acyl-carrier-protein] synthase family protein [Lentzea sp. NBRC 105346]GLZ29099.1 3-oxoacyl-ACP synthase [Lentzea sp. NBRC 105346]
MTAAAVRRVVVTGMGVVSSIGIGLGDFTEGLRSGRIGARRATSFDVTGFPSELVGEVAGFEPERWIDDPSRLGRASQFAVAAAAMAVEGVDLDYLRARRALISIGTTNAQSQDVDAIATTAVLDSPERMDPAIARRVTSQGIPNDIARSLGLSNVDSYVIGTACSAGNYGIGDGVDAIRLGEADFALCGGADAASRRTFAAFHRLGLVAPDACRPFDAGRKGIITGEGAGVLLLEDLESALARGAHIYAEVLGYGLNCDGVDPVAPTRESVARCIRLALDDAGVKPSEVGFISAHGTGTKTNDITECNAIRDVYGDSPPPVVALKSMLGHAMGAASSIAAIGCVAAMNDGFIPPTANHREMDPECAIDCVPNAAVSAQVDIVQNNGFAFGGDNAVVVLGRYDRSSR